MKQSAAALIANALGMFGKTNTRSRQAVRPPGMIKTTIPRKPQGVANPVKKAKRTAQKLARRRNRS